MTAERIHRRCVWAIGLLAFVLIASAFACTVGSWMIPTIPED